MWLLCVPPRGIAWHEEVYIPIPSSAFHGAVLTHNKNVEAHTKGVFRDPIEEASVLSDCLSQKLTLVESALESTWVGNMWSQKLRTGWPDQSKSLQHPVWCVITSGYL